MVKLPYPRARLSYSYFKSNPGYDDLRGRIRGFTLVELLIVIAIISIAALTAIPMMSSAAGMQIRSAVKKGFDYVIDFQNDGRLDKVDIINVDFDSTSEIKFDYLGSPYNGNDNPLNSGVIDLQAGGTTTTVTVEPVTGYVSIQ